MPVLNSVTQLSLAHALVAVQHRYFMMYVRGFQTTGCQEMTEHTSSSEPACSIVIILTWAVLSACCLANGGTISLMISLTLVITTGAVKGFLQGLPSVLSGILFTIYNFHLIFPHRRLK